MNNVFKFWAVVILALIGLALGIHKAYKFQYKYRCLEWQDDICVKEDNNE